jgi:hypothetical protein
MFLVPLSIQARHVFMQEPTLTSAYIPSDQSLRVVGDLHGQFADLCKLFEEHWEPGPGNAYLFNGNETLGDFFQALAEGATFEYLGVLADGWYFFS